LTKIVNQRCRKIKLVLTDVDGVLTDGGMYYSKEGDIMKKFHVRDGMGVTILRKNDIPTIIVTKEKNIIVKKWAEKMKIKKTYQGVLEKDKILDIVCKKFKINSEEVAYIGDDINDIPLLKKVGLSVTPKDGIKMAKKICHYTCSSKGGEGVLREVAELILLNK
jgi:3-deoxy-D-manno-octulosonate 8-phosphate phosphatase (KDO 8-P phosphatase)